MNDSNDEVIIQRMKGESPDLFLLRVFTVMLPKMSEPELLAFLGYVNSRTQDEWIKRRKAAVKLLTDPPSSLDGDHDDLR